MILFDLETTGLPKAEGSDLDIQPHIIEFGAIKLDDELKEISRIEFLCNPGQPLEPIITKITGLTDADLKDERPFVAYYNEV
jgi:DNA polymerase III epsilon subunit-like protein